MPHCPDRRAASRRLRGTGWESRGGLPRRHREWFPLSDPFGLRIIFKGGSTPTRGWSQSVRPSGVIGEPAVQPCFKHLDYLLVFELLDHLGQEGLDEERTGRLFINAACHQIEKVVLFDLGDSRAVAAHHIIGKDLELRLDGETAFV